MASWSSSHSSSSSSQRSSTAGTGAVASSARRDLSFLLHGADPAPLLASIEDEQHTLRRLHALLVQEQAKVGEEERLLRLKIQQYGEQQPGAQLEEDAAVAVDDGPTITEEHERMLRELDAAIASRR